MVSQELQKYLWSGQISKKSTNQGGVNYNIYCYTKKQFHECEWDDVTIKHRGKIYYDDGQPMNHPFEKIFNLNEHPVTDEDRIAYLIDKHEFEVLDKVNGHLVIVSFDALNENVLVSTKGSFDGELAEQDRKIVELKHIDETIIKCAFNYTFMFECLAEYDQHLLFDETKRLYNVTEDTLILLGAIDNVTGESITHDDLGHFARAFNVPVVRRFKELESKSIDINGLFDHTMTEGYVFHFPTLNFRFKVKTSEYVRLRYMKTVQSDSIVNVFYRSGRDNMYERFDEELHVILDALMCDFDAFYHSECVSLSNVHEHLNSTNREVAESTTLSASEKSHILSNGQSQYSKGNRLSFKKSKQFSQTDIAIKEFFEKNLYS